MNESISTRIKEVRKSLHMSQVEFAKFLGITQATVSGIESGNQIPGTDTALKIAKKCNGLALRIKQQKISARYAGNLFGCCRTAYCAHGTAHHTIQNS